MSSVLRNLKDTASADRELVGGKAASLGELMKLGVNVPTGFVVTTEVYGSTDSEQLIAEILDYFDKLGVERVAVRSSAVSEDAASASWAGQLDTYLNVSRDRLLEAIANCRHSINSEHAKAYVRRNSIERSEQAVAVIVQVMVEADIAGVLFTANPVTNDIGQCVVEAIYGLGELLVQGRVTPETHVIDKETGKIIDYTTPRQRIKLVFKNGQNTDIPTSDTETDANILSNAQLDELMEQARLIEQHYGQPQDIEWAFANEQLFILQSRPITTLSPKP